MWAELVPREMKGSSIDAAILCGANYDSSLKKLADEDASCDSAPGC